MLTSSSSFKIFLLFFLHFNYIITGRKKVCEGYVFTGVCLSTVRGGSLSNGGLCLGGLCPGGGEGSLSRGRAVRILLECILAQDQSTIVIMAKQETRSIGSYGLLPPANEVWGKDIFLHLSVILFTGGGKYLGRYHPGRYTPGQMHPPPRQCMLRYCQQAGSTHPTGMHSCSHWLYLGPGQGLRPRQMVLWFCVEPFTLHLNRTRNLNRDRDRP